MCDHSVSIMVFLIVRIEGIEGTAKPLIGLLTLLGLQRLVCLPLGRLEEGGKGGREEGRKGGREGGREKGRGGERERGREGGVPSHFFPSSISSFLPPFLRLGVSVSFPLSLLLPSSLPPFLPSSLPPFPPSSLPPFRTGPLSPTTPKSRACEPEASAAQYLSRNAIVLSILSRMDTYTENQRQTHTRNSQMVSEHAERHEKDPFERACA